MLYTHHVYIYDLESTLDMCMIKINKTTEQKEKRGGFEYNYIKKELNSIKQ